MLKRRIVLKLLMLSGVVAALLAFLRRPENILKIPTTSAETSAQDTVPPLGTDERGVSHVYLAQNGTPAENVAAVIKTMGGIERFIDSNDIVLLKPNAQWWNQGTTNTDAMKGFIDMVLGIPDFSGEIIVAENHQYDGNNSRGWNTEKRNGVFNLNELIAHYHSLGHRNVSKYHWQVAGTTDVPLEGDAQGDSRVTGPWDGDGYVWLEDSYYLSPARRKCLMTYPVFTSPYSGITIDLKNGAWKDGGWLKDRAVKFINFSALNHHGLYCGVTASVKNLMGVVDMSCGFPGDLPKGTYNTHHIGVSRLKELSKKTIMWRLTRFSAFKRYIYQDFHHTGGALGCFMRNVRMPDLNIITAEWVGWGSRTEPQRSFRPRAILAGRDPVALDYVAAKKIVLPGTPADKVDENGDAYKVLNNPDIKDGPLQRFLKETQKQGIGNLDTKKIRIAEYDVSSRHSQGNQV